MKGFITTLFISFVVLSGLAVAQPVSAAPDFYNDVRKQANAAAKDKGAGFGTPRDPREVVSVIIRGGLGIIGTLFVAYIIYAGFIILTSSGDSTKVDKGKSTIRTAILGLLIVLSAYSITTFVSNAVIYSARDASQDANIDWGLSNWFTIDNDTSPQRYNNEDPFNPQPITPFN